MNPDGLDPRESGDGRVTLAVLRNDVMHLVASVELLRGDLQALSIDFQKWQKTSVEDTQQHLLSAVEDRHQHQVRIDRLEHQMRLARWLLMAVWGVLAVVIASWFKSILGI